jgi:hypothetical protein
MPTFLDRYPIRQVVVDGNICTGVASVRISSGGNRRSRELTVVLAERPPFPINDWSTVQVNIGLTPETAYTRFWGYQLKPQSDLTNRHLTFTAYDPYVKVERGQLWTTDDPHLSAVPVPQGSTSPTRSRSNPPTSPTRRQSPGGSTTSGWWPRTGATTPSRVRVASSGTTQQFQFFWGEDRTLGEVISQLEEICLGYKTRGTRDGRIERVLLPTAPPTCPTSS